MQITAEIHDDGSGDIYAVSPELTLSVLPSKSMEQPPIEALPEGKVFHRNGIKMNLQNGGTQHVRWLVGELKGVRAYIIRDPETGLINVVLSDKDLLP